MTEREDNVYKAKLAEQAERYDGKSPIINMIHAGWNPLASYGVEEFWY